MNSFSCLFILHELLVKQEKITTEYSQDTKIHDVLIQNIDKILKIHDVLMKVKTTVKIKYLAI